MSKLSLLAISAMLFMACSTKTSKIVGTWKLDVASSKLDISLSTCPDNLGKCFFVFEQNGDVKFDIIDDNQCDPKVLSGDYEYDESKQELVTKWKSVERGGETKSLEGNTISKSFPLKFISDDMFAIEIGTETWHMKKQ